MNNMNADMDLGNIDFDNIDLDDIFNTNTTVSDSFTAPSVNTTDNVVEEHIVINDNANDVDEITKKIKKTTTKNRRTTKKNDNNTQGNVATSMSTNTVQSLITKLETIKKDLEASFAERDEVIDIAILALLTGQSMLMLGQPGTGKSAITEALCSKIEGGVFFQWLLNRTSDPSEILGPYSVKGMEQDQFLRVTDGKLPQANIAFLDEIFKCNEPTLNMLLPIINEKKFYNNGQAVKIPLISLFCASNETPDDESLDALYDRLLFRIDVKYIHQVKGKMQMFKNYIAGNKPKGTTTITIDELHTLQEEVNKVAFPDAVLKNYINFLNTLEAQEIIISDRRKNQCLKVMQASALLHGRYVVNTEDLQSLLYVLWKEPSDIPFIQSEIDKCSNPLKTIYENYNKNFIDFKNTIRKIDDPDEKSKKGLEIKISLDNISKGINKELQGADANTEGYKKLVELRQQVDDYAKKLIKACLQVDMTGGR